jgi:hypothetical protein
MTTTETPPRVKHLDPTEELGVPDAVTPGLRGVTNSPGGPSRAPL